MTSDFPELKVPELKGFNEWLYKESKDGTIYLDVDAKARGRLMSAFFAGIEWSRQRGQKPEVLNGASNS